jgi:hypothetical protein
MDFEFFDFFSVDEIKSSILKSKYRNIFQFYYKLTNDEPNERPDCEEVLNNRYEWALRETENLESDKFNAKEKIREVLELRINEPKNEITKEFNIYSIMQSMSSKPVNSKAKEGLKQTT